MLFEVHHRQLQERRQRIHGITQQVLTILVVTAGWRFASQNTLDGFLEVLIIAGIMTLAVSACYLQYNHNRTYLEIARVISRLNNALGLFENGKYLPGQQVYEPCFQGFGNQKWWVNIWHHMVIILIMTAVAICAVILK